MAKEGFWFEIEINPLDTSSGVSVDDFPEWEDIFNPFSMIDTDTLMTCASIEILAEKAEEDDEEIEVLSWDREIKRQGKVIRKIRAFHRIAAEKGTGEMMDFDQATKGMNALLHQMWDYCHIKNGKYVARFYCVADLRAPGFISAALDSYYGRNKNKEEN